MRSRLAVGAGFATAAAVLLGGAVVFVVSAAGDLEAVKQTVREQFPAVRQLSTDELRTKLDQGWNPVLIDVREAEEFAVSRLPGARRVDPSTASVKVLGDVAKDREIVVYCSVGYRSSRLAVALESEGYSNVQNLEGSIFEWAAKGYPLIQGQTAVHRVHPYSPAWAWLVPEELRAYTPADALTK